ncbi:MAG: hypothetical protein QW717_05490 [Candidatus Bathyarchaeia archaeon]
MKEDDAKILRTVPREKAFYFFTSIGNYTGENASSLKEFMEKIGKVDVKSLEFHLQRGDFERWMAEVLQDEKLAQEICKLRNLNVLGEMLKESLCKVVTERYKELVSS